MPVPEQATAYDRVPYRSQPLPQTRPERLAAVAKLFGLDAPPVETARVLEMGAASGGNLIPMAQDYPSARFVGIDASVRQVTAGCRVIDALGLKNVDLLHLDIMDVDESLGEFDYILSHGVFSWVRPAVQDRMIAICRRQLAPTGVGYVSYNTYPGWHVRGIVRDMMYYHGKQFTDPPRQLAQAKALVEFVVGSQRGESNPYKHLLKGELEKLASHDDSYLLHEHLEEFNQPLYFHEFTRKLALNGLQYLGEADFSTMVSTNFAPEVAQTLHRLGAHDILQMEQYMDYVRCRYFRQTLICRASVPLNRLLEPEVVKGFHLASRAAPVNPTPSLSPDVTEEFRTPGGMGIDCRLPLTKIALSTLARRWPEPLTFPALLAASLSRAEETGVLLDEGRAESMLAGEMLACMAAGAVEWSLAPARFTTEPGERPAATPLARLQAIEGGDATNLRGECITLDEIHRRILRHLDGTRDRAQLVEALVEFLHEGGHSLRRDEDGAMVTDDGEIRALLYPALDKVLANFATSALLAMT